ncbi:acyl-CoA dehydrogenase family protein [Gordonia humi]|uniref:acyl-CoA dehydrogenase family protein n=1 Tax=Gordonia humi TaxID=686429 RepID=UPI00361D6A33
MSMTPAADADDALAELRSVVQQFVSTVMPREEASRWDRENYYPREVLDRLASLGVMGLTVPEAYGGQRAQHPADPDGDRGTV